MFSHLKMNFNTLTVAEDTEQSHTVFTELSSSIETGQRWRTLRTLSLNTTMTDESTDVIWNTQTGFLLLQNRNNNIFFPPFCHTCVEIFKIFDLK